MENFETIRTLYAGVLSSKERRFDSAYQGEAQRVTLLENQLTAALPDNLQTTLQALLATKSDLAALDEAGAFVEGFRIGARLMLETLLQ